MVNRNMLIELLEPEVNAFGYELVDLELKLGGRSGVLRLFIDNEDGVTLDDCERVSHQVSGLLDVEDPIPGHYVLEVSSPGLNRRLRRHEDFERFLGERVKIQLRQPNAEGRRRFAGRLSGVAPDAVTVDVDGQQWSLPVGEIEMARLAPDLKL